MKQEMRFWITIIISTILMICISVFLINRYNIYIANKNAENINVGDNTNLEIIDNEKINQEPIQFDDRIGTLTIPDILLENAPIRESVELNTLSSAIGHFTSTSIYQGNVGLASHNSGGSGDYFKNLKNIKIGSEIYYQTNYGTKRYVVETKNIIDETDFSYLNETEDNKITLITCVAGQKEKRLCVQAVESLDGMNYGQ